MKHVRRGATVTLSILALGFTSAWAQTSGGPEEIIVTASKSGAATIMATPITIQAISQEGLERRGATEFNDFVNLIPGFSMSDQGAGNKRYVLRGITSSSGAGTVGVYLDEIVLTGENSQTGGGLQADPRLFDIQRVEVLKGPQGTTYGSSALSGVVRYITNKPKLNEFGGSARVAIGDQNHAAGPMYNTDVTVNIPVVTDVFALRVSGFSQEKPGYLSNRYGDDANHERSWANRIQGRLMLGDKITLDLLYSKQHTHAGNNIYFKTDLFGRPVPELYQSPPERLRFVDDLKLYNATLNYDVGFGTLTATASRTGRLLDYRRPASQVIAGAARVANPEDPSVRSALSNPRQSFVNSYEVRFASDWAGPVQALVGVYYQDDRRFFASLIPTVNSNGYPDPTSFGRYGSLLQNRELRTHVTEEAVFGEATWSITDKLKLIGGFRAFKFDNTAQANVILGTLGTPGAGLGVLSNATETSALGRVIASYDIMPDLKLYGQVAQGYRPGGNNDQSAAALGGATVPAGYNSDHLINYEAGVKYTSPDRRFTAALAGFYIDWTDIQLSLRTLPRPGFPQVYAYTGNAGQARVKGAEIDLHFYPIAALDLGLNAAWTDAIVLQTVTGGGVAGDKIPYTPTFTANVSADYRFPITGLLNGFVGGDVSYTSQRQTNFPSNSTSFDKLPGYSTVNLRAGTEWGVYRAAVIVRNLLDDGTVTDVAYQTFPALNGYFRNPPRTISLEFSGKF
ncbi:MAG: hypothetical protein JWM77_3728 [Rhodospirillales bacterium]|nr:hypothetical protein [Rhodospirillales bacterium]